LVVFSYSIYLVHAVVFRVVKQALISLQVPVGAVLPLRLLSGLTAGYVFYRLIETKMDRALAETIGTGYPA